MQKFAPGQASFETVGYRVSTDSLHASRYRHVFDIGTRIVQREFKRAEDSLDYRIDLMSWLDPDENISSVVGWTDSSSLIITRLEYADYSLVAWIAAGEDNYSRQMVYIRVVTSKNREQLYRFVIVTNGAAPLIAIARLIGPDVVYIGVRTDPEPPMPEPYPQITVDPEALNFPLTFTGATSQPQQLLMKNSGQLPVYLRSVRVTGDFHQKNTGQEILFPGDSTVVDITFSPTQRGTRTGEFIVDIDDGGKTYTALTGEAIISNRVSVNKSQFVDSFGVPVRLKSINWFGAESDIYVPHGIWQRSYKSIVDQIRSMGFNCIRLPFSGDLLTPGRNVATGAINYNSNPELVGKSALEVLDKIIEYCAEKKIFVVLDHHRRTAGNGADGSPVSETYSLNKWISNWLIMANRYASNEYVVGADVHNEPHLLSWSTWASYVEQCGDAIHAVVPDWIIFVEGVGSYNSESYWWGGQLQGVAMRPVKLTKSNRVAYSPHEYGQSVGEQAWLSYDGQPEPSNWPMNLYSVWRKNWGFIVEQEIAPVWVGEFGGKFGTDGQGNIGVSPNAERECQWLYHLELYLNGDFNGDGERDLPPEKEGISFSYWSFNPNSSDTGGLVQDDWTTPQLFKLRLLEPLMAGIDLNYLTSLTPIGASDVDDADLILVNHAGTDRSLRMSEMWRLTFDKNTPVGEVHWFASNVNPNTEHPGTVFVRVPGLNRTVRLANETGSDILQTGGSDSITLAKNNLPNVQLNVTGTADSVNLGTKTTKPAGAQSISGRYVEADPSIAGAGSLFRMWKTDAALTTANGMIGNTSDHQHDLDLGSHVHDVTAKTEFMGNGSSIGTTNSYIKLAAWYRVS